MARMRAGARIAAVVGAAVVLGFGAAPASASAARPAAAGASASVSPPVAVVIRVKPNFNFTDDLVRDASGGYRPVEDYGAGANTYTGVNLFPFFMLLLIAGGVFLIFKALTD